MAEERKEEKLPCEKCEKCGTPVMGGLTPSLQVLTHLRDNKKTQLTKEAKKLLQLTCEILSSRSFVLCLRCQREFSRILGNPKGLFVPYQNFDKASVAKDFLQVFSEREKERKEKEEKEKEEKMNEWLVRLVRREVRTDEVEFLDLEKLDERTLVCCAVPGCELRARPCDTSVKGKPLMANVSVQLVVAKDGKVIEEGGEPVLTKKRVIPLCLKHAHQAANISEKCGRGWWLNYYPLIDTIRRFHESQKGNKLGDLPCFQKIAQEFETSSSNLNLKIIKK
jgi:hypothetical protein